MFATIGDWMKSVIADQSTPADPPCDSPRFTGWSGYRTRTLPNGVRNKEVAAPCGTCKKWHYGFFFPRD